jgi:hypothetical protein
MLMTISSGSLLLRALAAGAVALFVYGCGSNVEQRSATGGGTGIAAGAALGGPVGAAVGVVVGGAGGAIEPEGVDQLAARLTRPDGNHQAPASGSSGSRFPPSATVKDAQRKLREEGFYRGRIDGIAGPQTKAAIAAYQRRKALPVTSLLDERTLASLGAAEPASGGSVPR